MAALTLAQRAHVLEGGAYLLVPVALPGNYQVGHHCAAFPLGPQVGLAPLQSQGRTVLFLIQEGFAPMWTRDRVSGLRHS